jgi:hypothetical protein
MVTVSQTEIDERLETIFSAAEDAVQHLSKNRDDLSLTSEKVDSTIAALFDAVNSAHKLGIKAKVPDFQALLKQ